MKNILLVGTLFIFSVAIIAVAGNNETRQTERFQDNGDGTVTDTSSGLMWAKYDSGGDNAMPWEEGERFCTNLSLGGYTDWRLPSIVELETLYDRNYSWTPKCWVGREGKIHINPIFRLTCSYYWSSTKSYFSFDSGLRGSGYFNAWALAVRGVSK